MLVSRLEWKNSQRHRHCWTLLVSDECSLWNELLLRCFEPYISTLNHPVDGQSRPNDQPIARVLAADCSTRVDRKVKLLGVHGRSRHAQEVGGLM